MGSGPDYSQHRALTQSDLAQSIQQGFEERLIRYFDQPQAVVGDQVTFTPNPLYPFQQTGAKLRFKASGRTAVVVEPQDFGRTILIEWSNGERSDVMLNDLKDAAEVVE